MKNFLQMTVDVFIVCSSLYFLLLGRDYLISGDTGSMVICFAMAIFGLFVAFMEWR